MRFVVGAVLDKAAEMFKEKDGMFEADQLNPEQQSAQALAMRKDSKQRKAISFASPENRRILQKRMLTLGRYHVTTPVPVHISQTSKVPSRLHGPFCE